MIDLEKYEITAIEFDREYILDCYPHQVFKKAVFFAEEYLERSIDWENCEWLIDGFKVPANLGCANIILIDWIMDNIPAFLVLSKDYFQNENLRNEKDGQVIDIGEYHIDDFDMNKDSILKEINKIREKTIFQLEKIKSYTKKGFEIEKMKSYIKGIEKLMDEKKNIELKKDFEIKEEKSIQNKGKDLIFKIQTISLLIAYIIGIFIFPLLLRPNDEAGEIPSENIFIFAIFIIIILFYLIIMVWASMHYIRIKIKEHSGKSVLVVRNNKKNEIGLYDEFEFILEKMWVFSLLG